MRESFTIGEVARRSGVPVRTIRFYESEGVIPEVRRTSAGYRVYVESDVRRLRLIRQVRLLGLSLQEVKQLVSQAFASDCGAYAGQLLGLITTQQTEVSRRIAELQSLNAELEVLANDVRRVAAEVPPGQTVEECTNCPLIDEVSGDDRFCNCASAGTQPARGTELPVRIEGGVMESNEISEAALEALVCDLAARPADAPSLFDIAPHIQSLRREQERLVIILVPSSRELLERFAAAEQACCSSIDWTVEQDDELHLLVRAEPIQLDVLEELWHSLVVGQKGALSR